MKSVMMSIETKSEMDHTLEEEEETSKEPVSPKSTMFLLGSPSPHIVLTVGFDSPIDVEAFRKQLPLALLKHPRFSSILVGDIAKKSKDLRWVRIENVNIDDHFIVPRIDNTLHESRLEADKFVEDYLFDLSKTSLKDSSKPLWEFHALNLKTSEAESIGIFRFHHSVGDGASLTSLLLSLTRQVGNPDALPTLPTPKKGKAKSLFSVAVWWLQVFWNTIVGVFMFLATTVFLKDSDVLIARANQVITVAKARRFVRRTVSLDDLKLIKNATNATINDVVLAMIEAGLSKNLIRRFNDKAEQKADNLIENIRMRIALVFNLRPLAGIPARNLSDMTVKDSKVRWGNEIGIALVPLEIRLPNDPLDHVRKVKAKADSKKCSLEAHYSLQIGNLAMKLFGIKAALIMSGKALLHSSMIVSNLPGPLQQIALYGNPIKFIAPGLYGFRNPVMINFQSYMNKMSMVVSVHEDANVDPHQLGDDIVESLILFKDAINR